MPNQFEDQSLDAVKDTVKGLNEQMESVLAKHRVDGAIQFEAIKGDDRETVRDLNQKMTEAHQHLEAMLEVSGAVDQKNRLAAYLKQPVESLFPVQPAGPQSTPRKSLGRAFVESDVYASARKGRKNTDEIEFDVAYKDSFSKATLGTDATLTNVDTEFPVESTRVGVIVDTLYQANNIAPLIPTIPTSQHAIKYLQETVNATAAAETEEGALAPEASIEWAEVVASIQDLAVTHPITAQLMEDEPAMQGIVNQRLRLFMNNREDVQILKGDGIAPNIGGLLNTAGIQNTNYSLSGATAQGFIEAIHNAKTNVMTAFQNPTDAVVEATTYEYMRLAKDSNLAYLLGPVADDGIMRVSGLPITVNQGMDDYTTATNVAALVGDFRGAATIFRRKEVTLSVTDSHSDEFLRSILRVKMVSRLALVVWRPTGFATVTRTA